MGQQFQEQGGAATMDPSPALRWLTSTVMTRMSSGERLAKKRKRCEKRRVRAGRPHVVEYFHEVDDGYSHLAAQLLKSLTERYDIELVCHLVGGPVGDNAPEPELLLKLSRYDAFHVAPHYGLEFPEHPDPPEVPLLDRAAAILAAQDAGGFVACAADVGRALWANDGNGLELLAERFGRATDPEVAARVEAGNGRRQRLQHYSGAMFYYGEEWYWGVDRLYHLEKRLAELGADREPGRPLLAPRPAIEAAGLKDHGSLTLEVFASLRSPYTAVGFDRAVDLARDAGVKLVVRPVLPMVMRGVPATRQKGMYIFADAAREAREAGVPYGRIYDPIGNPVRRCYSLYPWACEQGRGIELLSSFLAAAFVQGINTNRDRGLRAVVEQAGLDWEQARRIVGRPGWEEQLEQNRQAMYAAGLWGVPSFRLLDERGEPLLALWGQDRLWLFAHEIHSRTLKKRNAT
jgi:2-hydroxychromene-2-carboxylate isomerase